VDAASEPAADEGFLPKPSELALRSRALYTGAVVTDYALRTGLASAITGLMVPTSIRLSGRKQARRMRFYAELADRRDPEAVFVAPRPGVRIHTERGEGPAGGGGYIELLRFASPYLPLNPEIRPAYLRHERNAIARAQHWRHYDGPRPTLMVIHGFGASPAWFNTLFFSLPEFFEEGWDIVLFTIPFHGGRRGPRSVFNGAELFTEGFARLNEGIMQAICDLRVVVDYLVETGAPRIGVTGLSLGGYCSAVMGTVEGRLDFAIPNATVASIPGVMRSWFPANLGFGALHLLKGLDVDLIERSLMVTSPLNYDPVLTRDRLMVIVGLGDRLTPPSHSVELWEHWGRPALRWYPGSHILHFDRADYLDAMRELMTTPRLKSARGAA
jgi:pimeloyl-ACP methyl ester carboxylesterase